MSKRKFDLEITGYVTLELDDAVIDTVDDDWRKSLYNLNTPEQIAEHVGWNMAVNGLRLSSMDGWADQSDGNARVTKIDWDTVATESRGV